MQWLAATAFWTFIAVLYDLQVLSMPMPANPSFSLARSMVWTSAFYLVWIPFTVAVWRTTSRWTFTRLGWPGFLMRHLVAGVVVSMLQSAAVVLLSSALVGANGEPVGQMIVGQFRGRIYLQLIVYAGIVAAGEAMSYYGRWRDRDAQAARLEAQLSAARLDALRAQLQPHFLFNSLHAVASLVRDQRNAEAVRLISGLSDLLRRVLDADQNELPLADELELVRRYVEIQQLRFGDRLTASIDAADGLAAARVPALSVQPLVENALRHGLEPRVEGGSVDVRVRRQGASLVVEVADSGVGLPKGWTLDGSGGTGLKNLRDRMAALYGDEARLTVEPNGQTGTRVAMRVPLRSIA